MFLFLSGKLAKENIVLKVDDLKRKVEVLKLEVQETLKHKYVDFFPQYVKLDKLLDRQKQVTVDYELLHNQIEKEVKISLLLTIYLLFDPLKL